MTDQAQAPAHPAGLPTFERTRYGYHRNQVDDFVQRAVARLRDLEGALAAAREQLKQREGALSQDHSSGSHAFISDLLVKAGEEISQRSQRSRAEIEQLHYRAAAAADQAHQNALTEARAIVAAAQEQADSILADARAAARKITGAAEAETVAVREGSQRRLEALTGRHGETMSRLAGIRDQVAQLVAEDEARGPLSAEVPDRPGTQLTAPGTLAADAG